ncbi:NAD-dependent epimerase/dehydratase [Stachybotrys elegans]|uniref:NAD-dependent epimerase/dehydratase n=1 Tax=Stachybotrys elegans TaxID=80388 RepID=A0A8K0WQN5_9HYPO|nr:NAD-dependent epimerase/dehydratase [Stachybotrys elegans]
MANILITGGAGFIGQELAGPLLAANPEARLTLTDVIEPSVPDIPDEEAKRISTLKADLTDNKVLQDLLSNKYSHVYVLHGLMSGGAEANLELGLKVNFDSIRNLLDILRKQHPGTVVVFASSCAIYGNCDMVREFETLPQPKSSYGMEKILIELLLNDFSRRGLLDGRIVRLPTVIVRPGAPSAAASSFASGIVRESLKGIPNVLPVGQDLAMWVCSPATVVANLVKIKDIPDSAFGESRIVNLPGVTVTVKGILDALKQVGGEEALRFVEEKHDPKIEAIVGSWPARFDVSRALGLGLKPDGDVLEAVEAFYRSLQK